MCIRDRATPLAVSTLSAEVTQRDSSSSRCLHRDSRTHMLLKCPAWLSKDPRARFQGLKNKKCCLSCLQHKHSGWCKTCGSMYHHTLLHFKNARPSPSRSQISETAELKASGSSLADQVDLSSSTPVSYTHLPVLAARFLF